MPTFWRETLQILNEAAPYLLVGFFLAGVLDVFLRRYPRLTGLLTSRGRRPVFLAALLGAPLPLCSCSVLPAALALRRQGASRGTTASFLISVPETDVTSITLTYALLGPFMAVARPLAAVVTAITTGLLLDRVAPDGEPREGRANNPDGGTYAGAVSAGPDQTRDRESTGNGARPKPGHWLARALRFGFVEMFDDIIVQLVIGIVVAGAIVAWLPGLGVERLTGGTVASYLIMLVLGIPIYVCATASTPLALGFVASGVSPGAALVFLLVGPATNVASLMVLSRQFGRLALSVYVTALATTSVAMGLLMDISLGASGGAAIGTIVKATERVGTSMPTAATLVFLALIIASLWRTARRSK
jgi:uncharacterized membrane protein YraQ (UPF0718 family)